MNLGAIKLINHNNNLIHIVNINPLIEEFVWHEQANLITNPMTDTTMFLVQIDKVIDKVNSLMPFYKNIRGLVNGIVSLIKGISGKYG